MDNRPANSQTDTTTVKDAAAWKLAETMARCQAALAAAEESVQRAQEALATAHQRLRHAQDMHNRTRELQSNRAPAA
jgi:flagellin-like hook-associated protein FlgL